MGKRETQNKAIDLNSKHISERKLQKVCPPYSKFLDMAFLQAKSPAISKRTYFPSPASQTPGTLKNQKSMNPVWRRCQWGGLERGEAEKQNAGAGSEQLAKAYRWWKRWCLGQGCGWGCVRSCSRTLSRSLGYFGLGSLPQDVGIQARSPGHYTSAVTSTVGHVLLPRKDLTLGRQLPASKGNFWGGIL